MPAPDISGADISQLRHGCDRLASCKAGLGNATGAKGGIRALVQPQSCTEPM